MTVCTSWIGTASSVTGTRGAERISGFAAAEVIGRSCADNILTHVDKEGNSLCLGMCPLASTMADGENRSAEVYLHHKNGHRVPVSVRVTTLTDEQDRIIGGVEIFTDISAYESMEQRTRELEELALLDNLTRLANRRCVEKELLIRFDEEKRFGHPFGLLMMDIDHFKKFNDRFGHDVGDRVLQLVAVTLKKNARPFDMFGRWGGEEFIGVIRNIGPDQLKDIGERMRMLVANSYLIQDGERLKVTISLGGTTLISGDTVETLIKRADNLLYKSKHAGRNRLTTG